MTTLSKLSAPVLHVIMYHYVRDLPRTPFPRIKGMQTDAFRRQIAGLSEHYEMATLESALAMLAGAYRPERDLCLLTFDDGLKDHYTDVFPILAERRLQGLFFPITSCLEEHRVVPVHKNHFLMAVLAFDAYRAAVLDLVRQHAPGVDTHVDPAQVRSTYRFDTLEVATVKYLLNFRLSQPVSRRVLDAMFAEYLGDEAAFAARLYFSWSEARQMQAAGMLLGGHSHRHAALASLEDDAQRADLYASMDLLRRRLHPQAGWPLSYPYGKRDTSFTPSTVRIASEVGFCCAFSTELGSNGPAHDPFAIRRIDPKDAPYDGQQCHPLLSSAHD